MEGPDFQIHWRDFLWSGALWEDAKVATEET
jgi:hypothetical protein